jgi:hypothetical protein
MSSALPELNTVDRCCVSSPSLSPYLDTSCLHRHLNVSPDTAVIAD